MPGKSLGSSLCAAVASGDLNKLITNLKEGRNSKLVPLVYLVIIGKDALEYQNDAGLVSD